MMLTFVVKESFRIGNIQCFETEGVMNSRWIIYLNKVNTDYTPAGSISTGGHVQVGLLSHGW